MRVKGCTEIIYQVYDNIIFTRNSNVCKVGVIKDIRNYKWGNCMLSLRTLSQKVKQNNNSDNETQDSCANGKIYTYMRSVIQFAAARTSFTLYALATMQPTGRHYSYRGMNRHLH